MTTLMGMELPNKPCLVLPKWSPQLSTIFGIIEMGILNKVNIQLAYWRVKGSYIPVAAMLLTTMSFYQVVSGDLVRAHLQSCVYQSVYTAANCPHNQTLSGQTILVRILEPGLELTSFLSAASLSPSTLSRTQSNLMVIILLYILRMEAALYLERDTVTHCTLVSQVSGYLGCLVQK